MPWVDFDLPFTFSDGAKVPDTLRHGALGIFNHRVMNLVVDGVVSYFSIEGNIIARVGSSDTSSRSKGRLPLLQGA